MASGEKSLIVFAAKFGAIGGIAAIVISAIFFATESEQPPFLPYLLLLGVILWGQISYKRAGTPPIGYGEQFGLGVLVTVYFAVVSSLYLMLHLGVIDPGLIDKMLTAGEQVMRDQGISGDQLKQAVEFQKMFVGPVTTPLLGLITYLIGGAVLSLITSIFMRRKEAPV